MSLQAYDGMHVPFIRINLCPIPRIFDGRRDVGPKKEAGRGALMKPARGPCAPREQAINGSVRSAGRFALDLVKDVDSGGKSSPMPTRLCFQLSFTCCP